MPSSSPRGKFWTQQQLKRIAKQTVIDRALDIGAGQGTYRDLCNNIVDNCHWTAVEVWPDYVQRYDLNAKYHEVIVQDARTVDYTNLPHQNIVFAGDVLEHMTKPEAQALVDQVLMSHDCLVISIPIVYMPQDEFEGNPFEIHVKPDWSHQEVVTTWNPDIVACTQDHEIGVYILSRNSKIRSVFELDGQEHKVYSQNGEDGIIAHIFGQIDTTDKLAVEFGVGDGQETNTRLLAEQGWRCQWFDAHEIKNIPTGVTFRRAWLTPVTLPLEFAAADIPKEFDLLSIDVDGNDYHLRESIKHYRPRVIIQEYNGCYGPDVEYIMPRNDTYQWQLWSKQFGASLLSLTQQANDLGYDLVYCESRGVNAFYVRRDINPFPALTAEQAWRPLWWADQV